MTAPLAIFDLDGTLIDTAPDLVTSLNSTIAEDNLAPVTYEDLMHLVGQGAKTMIKRAYALREQPLSDERLEELFLRFIDYYKQNIPGDSKPYPRIIEALLRLKDAGFELAVCTNKTAVLTLPLLEQLDLTQYFPTITCGDTFPVRKPDAAHIIGTVELAKGRLDNCVMIGDSVNDILAAKNAGVPSIGVTFGYTDIPVEQLDPSYVISSFDELTPELLLQLISDRAKAA